MPRHIREREFKWILNGKVPEPCPDLMKWAQWLETADRHVGRTELMGGEILVSTVFLGLDHNHGGDKPGQFFETMVFGQEHLCKMFGREVPMRDDMGQWRYDTWEQAEEGHAKVVAMMREQIAAAEATAKGMMGRTVKGDQ